MLGLVCKILVVLCLSVLCLTVSAAPGLFELPSRSVRLIRSDPSAYDGYENSFYRGYGSDNQQFRFNSPQNW
ncbi:Neuropeptide-Like Protein [Caenorhabditis elegans]|uniref:Neuropeptide-Like Protein n=1 Tax=Caenorhabditis elegans TaxID=6239 RepID=Q7YX92_CAEEL|nr:Neuropeptide-Like Protein [Caenorhabditis elegans]CAE17685.2 Neuropeptide-Like Protein [Caenorhabditis elegans]|eukprot:NP_001021917.1 Neuropeptide-Like Protein [Caenorhabditis elegans]